MENIAHSLDAAIVSRLLEIFSAHSESSSASVFMNYKRPMFIVLLFFWLLLLSPGLGYSKTTENSDTTKLPDRVAEFPGGDEAFLNYIIKNFNYPRRCRKEEIEGRVLVKFVVDVTGEIDRIEIIEPCPGCPEFDKEAIRVLQNCPPWIPAVHEGRYVNAWRTLPIRFSLK